MTTYWLLGEKKNPEANNEADTQLPTEADSSSEQAEHSKEPEQLLVSQQPNAPSITRELVEDTNIKIEDPDKKLEQETTPLLQDNPSTASANNNTGNGSVTHPL